MFGFLRPLKNAEGYRQYRQAYARCCQFQRSHFGIDATILLSYESVAVYLLAMDTDAIPALPADATTCCRLRSMGGVNSADDSEVGRFCASFGMLLLEVKLNDDRRDGANWLSKLARMRYRKRFAAARRVLSRSDATGFDSSKLLAEIDQAIEKHLALETSGKEIAIENYAIPTGEAFALLFGALPAKLSKSQRAQIAEVCRCLGHAIIAFDCAVDWERDRDADEFNPLTCHEDRVAAMQFAAAQLSCAVEVCESLNASNSLTGHVVASVRQRVIKRSRSLEEAGCSICEEPTVVSLQANRKPAPLRPFNAASSLILPVRAGDCDCDCLCSGCDACTGCDGDLGGCCDNGGGCCGNGKRRGFSVCCDVFNCIDCCDFNHDRRKNERRGHDARNVSGN